MLQLDHTRWLERKNGYSGGTILISLVMFFLAAIYLGVEYWSLQWISVWEKTHRSQYEFWRNTDFFGVYDFAIYQNNIVFTGTSEHKYLGPRTYALDKETNQLVWSTERTDSVLSTSTVDGSLILVDAEKVLYALNNSTGEILWKRKSYSYSPMALSDTDVFTIHYRGYGAEGILMAQDQNTGDVLWQKPLLTPPLYSGAVKRDDIMLTYFDDVLYLDARSENGHSLVAINPDNGAMIWETPLQSDTYNQTYSENILFLVNSDERKIGQYLTAYDLHSGRETWRMFFEGINHNELDNPTIIENRLYLGVGTERNYFGRARYIVLEQKLLVLEAESGKLIWKFNEDLSHGSISHFIEEGVIYIGTEDGWLIAFDNETGRELWRTEISEFPIAYFMEQNVLIVSTKSRRNVYGFNKDTGEELWEIEPQSSFFSGDDILVSDMIINNGMLYVSIEKPRVYAVHIEDGKTLWTWQDNVFPAYHEYSFAGVDDDAIYVVGPYGELFALKAMP